MTVVDSSVWIDYLADKISPRTAWLDRYATPSQVGITDLILMEVLRGLRIDASFRATQAMLLGLPVISTGGSELAIASAEHFRWLRKRGITIRSAIDCVTATLCIREGHQLLHNDRDFDPFEKHFGLKILRP